MYFDGAIQSFFLNAWATLPQMEICHDQKKDV